MAFLSWGSSFVLFWKVTMLVFFSPAEEIWSSSGKQPRQLFERCGSKTDPCPYCPHSSVCKLSHSEVLLLRGSSHWLSLNFCICNPPIIPKRISWAEDSAAAPHSLYLELFMQEDSSEKSSLPPSQNGKCLIQQLCKRSIILSIQWPLGCQW